MKGERVDASITRLGQARQDIVCRRTAAATLGREQLHDRDASIGCGTLVRSGLGDRRGSRAASAEGGQRENRKAGVHDFRYVRASNELRR